MPSRPDAHSELAMGLALAGLAGGLLTAFAPLHRLLGQSFDVFTGAWAGLAIAGYLALGHGPRSIARAAALVLLSAAAVFLAMMAASATEIVVMVTTGSLTGPHAVSMFVGGAVAALILSAATFILYVDSGSAVWRAAVQCGIAGGVLGVAGHALSNALGNALQVVSFDGQLSRLPGPLLILWQTGVGLVMGMRWPEDPGQGTLTDAPAPRVRVPMWAVLLMIAAIVPMALAFTRQREARARMEKNEAAMAAYRATQPPLENLPAVETRPINYVTIKQIGDYRMETAGPGVVPANSARPQAVEYYACYSNVRGKACAAIQLHLTEYATPAWAAYALRGLPATGWNGSQIGTEAVDTSFGQRILDRPVPSPSREVYWRSDVFVVHVRAFIDANPVIRAYLDRYPSSL